jgi:microcystin-dependent protein
MTIQATGGASIPAGALMPYGGTSAPTGWLLCDGSAVSRTTYAFLFSKIATAYGVGDGSTTFNLPDLRQRFPMGKAESGTGATLGATGGEIDHAHGGATASHVLDITQIPSHQHSIVVNGTPGSASAGRLGAGTTTPVGFQLSDAVGGGLGHTHNIGTANAPFQTFNYIIKT